MCLHWRNFIDSTPSDQQNKLKIFCLFLFLFYSSSASNAEINGPRSVLHMLTAYTQMLINYRISENKYVSFSCVFFSPGHYHQIIICLQLKHALAGWLAGGISWFMICHKRSRSNLFHSHCFCYFSFFELSKSSFVCCLFVSVSMGLPQFVWNANTTCTNRMRTKEVWLQMNDA